MRFFGNNDTFDESVEIIKHYSMDIKQRIDEIKKIMENISSLVDYQTAMRLKAYVDELDHCDNVISTYPKSIFYDESTCGSCHAKLDDDDKYCRECGTKRGQGEYKPYMDIMECIYGPMPVERKHTCPACGKEWVNVVMVDNDKYCPVCGHEVKVEQIGSGESFFRN